jgi:transcriptional regulator
MNEPCEEYRQDRRVSPVTTNCDQPGRIVSLHLTFEWNWLSSIGMSNKEPPRAQFLRGTLDLMVLQSLASMGPLHGYAIAARLEQVSRGALVANMGTLYPGLMRLEQRGLIRASWGVTENQRKARFYSITAAGKRMLASEKRDWERMVSIIQALFAEPS